MRALRVLRMVRQQSSSKGEFECLSILGCVYWHTLQHVFQSWENLKLEGYQLTSFDMYFGTDVNEHHIAMQYEMSQTRFVGSVCIV